MLLGEAADPKQALRFLAEAEAVAAFSHPNIVQVYEVGQDDGLPFMALKSRRASVGLRATVSLRFARVSRNPFSRSASLSSLTLYRCLSEASLFIPRREAGTAVF